MTVTQYSVVRKSFACEHIQGREKWLVNLVNTQGEPGRIGKLQQEQISPNHVPTIILFSVLSIMSRWFSELEADSAFQRNRASLLRTP